MPMACVTRVIWSLAGRERIAGVLQKPPHTVNLGDVKKLWHGPACLFLLKTPELIRGKYHWTLIIDDNSPVPWIDSESVPQIVAKLKLIEKPNTIITYCIEGRNDTQVVKISKPPSQVTLMEVKDNFPGSSGVFLFKTFDGASHHWSIVIDNFANVPSIEGDIVVQIKMKNRAKTVVELRSEGGIPGYFRLDKPANEVTLLDIRPFYGGPPGIFLFKTPENDGFCWTVFANENSPVPICTEDLIVVKVKPMKRISNT
eukprot:TRINITY_DN11397_c0_g1_i1.p1 TRINITY_DN11397_c0_g1~~TRINITY_DN11397_c0_g1_i1.p1  ORF type:complete len:289 (+),score=43.49 TRINITY_DN11397_c0_g1_i1:97-867(+)